MLKWFSNKIVRMGLEYDKDRQSYDSENIRQEPIPVSKSAIINMDQSIRFSVLVGQGGVILESRLPSDSNALRGYQDPIIRTYIIADGESIAERIGQIVSMELLRV